MAGSPGEGRWCRPRQAATGESGTSWVPYGVVPARPRPVRRAAARLALVPALVVAVAGCGRGPGMEPDTARFEYGSRRVEVPLTACGREGDVVVLGGARGGIVVQAEADVGEGGEARTGVTADLGDEGILGAFGADMRHGPAGEITAVRVDGDRLVVEGEWVGFDAELRPAGDTRIEGSLVARCPATEEEIAAAGS